MVLVLLIIAVQHILQRAGILKDRMLLSTQLLVAVMINLVVEGLYHMGHWQTDVSALSGPLICLNYFPRADHSCSQLLVMHGAGTP